MRYGFGVDIFGNQTKIGFFDEAGNLLDKWKITTTSMNRSNQILPGIAEELEGYMKLNRLFEDDIIGIGVGIPGPVSGDSSPPRGALGTINPNLKKGEFCNTPS